MNKNSDVLMHTRQQEVFLDWLMSILSYIVILNIFVHFVHDFYIENFMYSLLVAVVLKLILVAVVKFEHKVSKWFDRKKGRFIKVAKLFSIWAILFGSKFLIIEIIDIIFGDKVELHNFIALILMIISMMLFRGIVVHVYEKLGNNN